MKSINIVCIGGGPAGLYFSLLIKSKNPHYQITVLERNRRGDTVGWGLVFSDQTVENLIQADQPTAQQIMQALHHWNDIEVHFKGQTIRSGGHGFSGIGRAKLLSILQKRCEELGVRLLFDQEPQDESKIAQQFNADLIIAADGIHSTIRTKYARHFQPTIETRLCRYIWLATKQKFPAFTFAFKETQYGWFQAHAYQYDDELSSFIVETPNHVWHQAGLDKMTKSDAIGFCEKLFVDYLGGQALMGHVGLPQNCRSRVAGTILGKLYTTAHSQGSTHWLQFPRISCQHWVHSLQVNKQQIPIVLLGDAAHSAHFSIGSGTKLAMEDAIELAECLKQNDLQTALMSYQQKRAIDIVKLQNAARNSTEWFENMNRYSHMEAPQFAYSLLTRSQRLSHENLRMRDPDYIHQYEQWLMQRLTPAQQSDKRVPPMFLPFQLRNVRLKNRIVVSPMAQYSAVDGLVGDFHLVHLGSRAMGGAALVFAEMTAVSADARITPGCPGIYTLEQMVAWKRIVDFVHANSDARIAIQLGHAGPKGSTKRAWDGIDQPLAENNWPLLAASEQRYIEGVSQTACAITEEQMQRVQEDFVRATVAVDQAGFDWLELHCAHGYLLSTFISPLTNQRTDQFGGSLENRCRYPLQIFSAIRKVWPAEKPISVRISAHDWVEGGIIPADAVSIARLFKQAGADMIDCSSGQVSKKERPVYGRLFQTPFADQIRNEARMPTIAVGAITDADQVNSIIASGRADLCAIARPHLANPAWTLHEAAKLGFGDVEWPVQYQTGKWQLEKNLLREK